MAPPLDFNATLAEQLRDAGMQMRAMTKPQKQRVTPDISADTPPNAPEAVVPAETPVTPAATPPDDLPNVPSDAAPHLLPPVSQNAAQATAAPTVHDSHATQNLDGQNGTRHPSHSNGDTAQTSTQDSRADSFAHSTKNSFGSHTASVTPPEGVISTKTNTINTAVTGTVSTSARNATNATPGKTVHGTSGVADRSTADSTADQTATQSVCATAHATDSATTVLTGPDAVSPTPLHTAHGAAPRADTQIGTRTGSATATVTVTDTAHATTDLISTRAARYSDDNSHNVDTSTASSSHDNSHDSGFESSPEHSMADTYGKSALNSHSHTEQHTSADGAAAPSLPDAASELWAMSHHSEAPTLSERSWTGGVRGAVLDALRGLAGGRDHVLVNLKRLATHTGISYGSVRNAMSRLTRSGDIRTRQIRMADGHGVRVEFLTLPGQEGTGVATLTLVSSQSAVLGQAGLMGQAGMRPQEAQPYAQTPLGMPFPAGEYLPTGRTGGFAASTVQAGGQHGQAHHGGFGSAEHAARAATQSVTQQEQHPAPYTAQQTVTVTADPQGIHDATQWTRQQTQGYAPITTDERGLFYAQQGMTPATQTMTPAQQPMQQPAYQAVQQVAQQGSQPMAPLFAPQEAPLAMTPDAHSAFVAPVSPARTASFWDTEDSLFTLAWPHVIAAGLRMEHVRALAPIFTVQGFDAAVLPRTLRYLDWELEQLGVPEDIDEASAPNMPADLADTARQLTQAFLRTLQRRGTWPRPAGYEEGDD